MFKTEIYNERRKRLKKSVGSGVLLFIGNEESPMNYPANPYPFFRQDSHFLYFFGLDSPSLAAVIDIDENKEIIFGDDICLEDVIWMGHLPKMKDRAAEVGVRKVMPRAELGSYIRRAVGSGRRVHYLPPYRAESARQISEMLGIKHADLKARASLEFIKGVVDLRLVKGKEEVREIETALEATSDMYRMAMAFTKPGLFEYEVAGAMEGAAACRGMVQAFPMIVSVDGQTLHNHTHNNLLAKGRLLVADTGAESPMHYASDITRTIPVGGKFNRRQRDIYEIVLAAQETGIKAVKPGVSFKEVHLKAARVIACGLKDLGLMKGDVDEAVSAGAHAFFFVHGLGHNLGLDVHDMEDLGEDNVGYDGKTERSPQFGLAYLRMVRPLRPGNVMTVEPGIYFIPALFDLWKKDKKFTDFIVYDKVEKYLDFGGIRIEDDVLVTETGRRVLGCPIPKKIEDVEAASKPG